MKKLLVRSALVAFVLGSSFASPAAATRLKAVALQPASQAAPPAEIWREIDEASLGTAKQFDRQIIPQRYRVFELDEAALFTTLNRAPMEFSEAAKSSAPVLMLLPMPDGTMQRFRIQESPVMEPALAARRPDLRTFNAQGIDDPAAVMRFDHTPAGFHAMVLSPNGTVFVDPYSKNDTRTYISYYKRDYVRDTGWHCDTVADPVDDASSKLGDTRVPSGSSLRTYRLALACTGEYAAFHGGTVPLVEAQYVTLVNRINSVYEVDLAVRVVLVANNSLLIFLNGATDPYTNNNGVTMLGQNQTQCTNIIGSANYDVGHVVSTGGGGVAGLGVICNSSNKARGVTGLGSPIGDPFYIDYVAHEMGHQFGGNHTFNGSTGSCSGGNRNASTAYEVGSGSTIQAYAGICGTQDLQPNSDAYFHGKSYDEMVNHTTVGGGSGCGVVTSTGNNPPVIDAGPGFTIPVSTPFELTPASYSDPNGDELTFCWEQFDLGAAGAGTTDNGSSPILRSFNPSLSPTRVFPKISSLVSNTAPYGEVLPTTSRTMNFRCTARDNRVGGGGVDFDSTTVTSSTSAGPFLVTAPNSATTFAGGSSQTVTWNVANTNAAPVNTANVSIFLSLDGGVSFPICLLANTPNDGSQLLTIPNVASTTARIKVKGAGNIFFDISNANFTITAATNGGDSPGVWDLTSSANFLRNSNTAGSADAVFGYGAGPSTLVPLTGDWDGNHSDTAGLYDPATGFFFLRNSNSGGPADLVFSFGAGGAGVFPLRGDWNGDGVDTTGIYVQATGTFFLRNANSSGPADIVFSFGPGGTFRPLTGDWNADGVDTIGIYDVGTGNFFLRNSNTSGSANAVFSFGAGGATPLVGDWNLDGRDTIGIYFAASGTWFLRNTNSSGAADVVFGYGPAGATPLVGDWDAL